MRQSLGESELEPGTLQCTAVEGQGALVEERLQSKLAAARHLLVPRTVVATAAAAAGAAAVAGKAAAGYIAADLKSSLSDDLKVEKR